MNRKRLVPAAIIGTAFALTAAIIFATPQRLNYQGYITQSGLPMSGPATMEFRLFDADTGGAQLCSTNPQAVTVTRGRFNYEIGSEAGGCDLAAIDWAGADVFLEVVVGGQTLTPRERVVPAAMSLNSDKLGGQAAAAFATASHAHDGVYIKVSGDTMTGALTVQGGFVTAGDITAATGTVTAAAFMGDGSGLTNLPVAGGDFMADGSVSMTGALIVNNTITATGTVTAPLFDGAFDGDGSALTSVDAATLSGLTTAAFATATHAHDADYVNISGDTMTGALTVQGGFVTDGNITAATGTVTAAAFVGDGSGLTNLPVAGGDLMSDGSVPMSGALIVNNAITATGTVAAPLFDGAFDGDGSALTSVDAATLSGQAAADFASATHDHDTDYVSVSGDTMTGSLTVQGGIITDGNITAATGTVTAGAVDAAGAITGSGIEVTGNATAAFFIGDGSQLTNLPVAGGDFMSDGSVPMSGALIVNNAITATGTVTAPLFDGAFDGDGSALTSVDAATLSGQAAADFASATHDHDTDYVSVSGDTMTGALTVQGGIITDGNITAATGTVTAGAVDAAGAITGSGIEVTGNATAAFFIGDGSQLTNLPVAGGDFMSDGSVPMTGGLIVNNTITATGTVTAPLFDGAFDGDGSALTSVDAATLDGYATTAFATASHAHDGVYLNVSGDTMTGALTVQGGIVTDGNITAATGTVTAGAVDAAGAITGSGIEVTGNATAAFFIGDGSQLTNLPVAGGAVAKIGDAMTGPLVINQGDAVASLIVQQAGGTDMGAVIGVLDPASTSATLGVYNMGAGPLIDGDHDGSGHLAVFSDSVGPRFVIENDGLVWASGPIAVDPGAGSNPGFMAVLNNAAMVYAGAQMGSGNLIEMQNAGGMAFVVENNGAVWASGPIAVDPGAGSNPGFMAVLNNNAQVYAGAQLGSGRLIEMQNAGGPAFVVENNGAVWASGPIAVDPGAGSNPGFMAVLNNAAMVYAGAQMGSGNLIEMQNAGGPAFVVDNGGGVWASGTIFSEPVTNNPGFLAMLNNTSPVLAGIQMGAGNLLELHNAGGPALVVGNDGTLTASATVVVTSAAPGFPGFIASLSNDAPVFWGLQAGVGDLLLLENIGGPVFDVNDSGDMTATGTVRSNSANSFAAAADGYINFGATTGSGGYGFRDSAGTLEYKNDGGGWLAFGGGGGDFMADGSVPMTGGLDMAGNAVYGVGSLTASGTITVGANTGTDGYDVNFYGTYSALTGSRMFWDASKSAFRAGNTPGNQWDDGNVGQFSIAAGFDTIASGESAVSLGRSTIASGAYSTAIGMESTASNSNTVAIGYNAQASSQSSMALGTYTTASGDYSLAAGRWTTAGPAINAIALGSGVDNVNPMTNNTANSLGVGFNSTVPTFFVGPGSGIGAYGNVGIRTTTPATSAALEIAGTDGALLLPRMSAAQQDALTGVDGMLIYNAETNKFRGRENGAWSDFGGGDFMANGSVPMTGGLDMAGNAVYGVGSLTASGTITVGANTGADGYDVNFYGTAEAGTGSRLFWDASKSALRAGRVLGGSWDDGNVGNYSFASGYVSMASGSFSTAMGSYTIASGWNSAVIGRESTASGWVSTALGGYTTASGDYSIAAGQWVTAGPNANTIALGTGVDDSNRMTNNTINSLGIGFNSTVPTFFVGPGSGIGTYGKVGVGTSVPESMLDVRGMFNVGKNDGTIGYDVNLYGTMGVGSKVFWNAAKSAFRAGRATGVQWDVAAIGNYSIGLGYNTTAGDQGSVALGWNTTASGGASLATGDSTVASGASSTAMGTGSTASATYAAAIGFYSSALGDSSLALGQWLNAGPAANAIAIGKGIDTVNRMVNNTTNSLGIGFNSTVPTLFVGPGSGIGTYGSVGIGTTGPTYMLEVNGSMGGKTLNLTNTGAAGDVLTINSGTGGNAIDVYTSGGSTDPGVYVYNQNNARAAEIYTNNTGSSNESVFVGTNSNQASGYAMQIRHAGTGASALRVYMDGASSQPVIEGENVNGTGPLLRLRQAGADKLIVNNNGGIVTTSAPATPEANAIYGPLVPKAWARFYGAAGAVTTVGAYNVASVTSASTGNYEITLNRAFANTNYVVMATAVAANAETWNCYHSGGTASSVVVSCRLNGTLAANSSGIHVVMFGNQ